MTTAAEWNISQLRTVIQLLDQVRLLNPPLGVVHARMGPYLWIMVREVGRDRNDRACWDRDRVGHIAKSFGLSCPANVGVPRIVPTSLFNKSIQKSTLFDVRVGCQLLTQSLQALRGFEKLFKPIERQQDAHATLRDSVSNPNVVRTYL